MTTDTEALRRAFEAFSLDGGLTPGDLEWNGRFYIVPFTQDEWLTFQAGHAAAKAEAVEAVDGRWYFVSNNGIATLCIDREDATEGAVEADMAYPHMAPHRAVQLVPASQLAAAVAAERDRCIDIIERYRVPVGNSAAGEMAAEWTMDALRECRDAIRAGEPSDGCEHKNRVG